MKRHNDCDIAPVNRKYMAEPRNEDIVETISNILQCNVCLELPNPNEFYQCPWSHLLCATCAFRLLADASRSNTRAKCPSCRRQITYENISNHKNYLVMKIMLELPKECTRCNEQCKFRTIDNHMKNECQERLINCTYRGIGCSWSGTYKQLEEHNATCEYPHKKATDLVESIKGLFTNEKSKWVDTFIFLNLKNSEGIHFRDVELRGRFCTHTRRLLLETFPFNAFEEIWTIRVQSTKNSSDGRVKRKLKYRMVLNSKPVTKLLVGYYLLESPKEKLEMITELHRFTFANNTMKSPYKEINLIDSNATNKILAKKSASLRIGMFIN